MKIIRNVFLVKESLSSCSEYHLFHLVLCSLSHAWLFATPRSPPPGCSVHGILQARTLERVAVSSREPSQPRGGTLSAAPVHWQAGSLPLSYLGVPLLPSSPAKSTLYKFHFIFQFIQKTFLRSPPYARTVLAAGDRTINKVDRLSVPLEFTFLWRRQKITW